MKNLLKTNERRGSERFFLTGKPLAVMRPAPSCPGKLLRISRSAAEIVYCSAWGGADFLGHEFTVKNRDQGGRRYGRRFEETVARDRGNAGRP
jgi:hypothetical protein